MTPQRPQLTINRTLGQWGRRSIETAPLSAFLVAMAVVQPDHADEWVVPFVAGAIPAIYLTSRGLVARTPQNVLMLGVNAYLILGASGLVLGIEAINALNSQLRAVGMLIVVTVVIALDGVWRGFIGVERGGARGWGASLVLFAAAVALTVGAYGLRDLRPWSEFVPFVLLFGLNMLVDRHRARSGS